MWGCVRLFVFLLIVKIFQLLFHLFHLLIELIDLFLILFFDLNMVMIKSISFCLIEHESIDNAAEIPLKFIFYKRKWQEVCIFYLIEDLLFFYFVFHFVNLFNRRIIYFAFLTLNLSNLFSFLFAIRNRFLSILKCITFNSSKNIKNEIIFCLNEVALCKSLSVASNLHLQLCDSSLKSKELLLQSCLLSLKSSDLLLNSAVLSFLKIEVSFHFFFNPNKFIGKTFFYICSFHCEDRLKGIFLRSEDLNFFFMIIQLVWDIFNLLLKIVIALLLKFVVFL